MKFTTTIKRKYWEMKQEDADEYGHFVEYKSMSEYWNKRLSKIKKKFDRDIEDFDVTYPVDAVFLVGNVVHRRLVCSVRIVSKSEVPEKYRSAITTDRVWRIDVIGEYQA